MNLGSGKKGAMPAAELSSFCGQVALVLSSGLQIYDGMETLAAGAKGGAFEDMYDQAAKRVLESGTLYGALREDGRWPEYLVEMVGIGEQSGHLEEVMQGLAEYYEREDRIRSSIQSAITYPLTLGAMLVVIVVVVLWKVLPVFRRVLSSLGVGMTNSGSVLMSIGANVGWVVMALVALALILALACVILMRTKRREKTVRFIGRVFPPIQRLKRRLSSTRVASVLSMMLSGGYPMGDSLRAVLLVLDDEEAKGKVENITSRLEQGEPFADAIQTAGLFEPIHNRMVRMGVAAGREDQVMRKVADVYEEQVETEISGLISVIEPTLVALLAVVIGAILLSVMLPMAGILTSMF